jgi:predicted nucleic acid-binding protein
LRPTVYIETTIVSYLTSRGSNDSLMAGQIGATRGWWDVERHKFDLYTSQLVLDEAAAGDPSAAAERFSVLSTLPSVPVTGDAVRLADALVARAALPNNARIDALHVGTAATNGLSYLLTWNCRHLANATLRAKVERVCRDQGYEPPVICTPLELEVEL